MSLFPANYCFSHQPVNGLNEKNWTSVKSVSIKFPFKWDPMVT